MFRSSRRVLGWVLAGSLGICGLTGCALEKDEAGAARFQEAIPEPSTVQLPGPETSDASLATRSALAAGATAASAEAAKYYVFTRQLRDDVNRVTASVLGAVHLIVRTRPTSVEEGEAVWGPWTESLEPATWRFRVTEVEPGAGKYEYVLEGRPKTSSSDSDYRPVLQGHGFGRWHEQHGDGELTLDMSAAHALDPVGNADDSGTITITHDLPRTITRDAFALPRVVTAEVRPSASEEWFTVESAANEDGTGELELTAFADIDESRTTQPENVTLFSRWRRDGAGRAEATLSGGDIPAAIGGVQATECWGSDFTRSFYSDSVEHEPTEGDPLQCVYE